MKEQQWVYAVEQNYFTQQFGASFSYMFMALHRCISGFNFILR